MVVGALDRACSSSIKCAGPASGPAQVGLSRLLLGRVVAAATAGRIACLAGAVDRRVVGRQAESMDDGHVITPLRLLHRNIRCKVVTVAISSRRVGSKVWRDRAPHRWREAGRPTQIRTPEMDTLPNGRFGSPWQTRWARLGHKVGTGWAQSKKPPSWVASTSQLNR